LQHLIVRKIRKIVDKDNNNRYYFIGLWNKTTKIIGGRLRIKCSNSIPSWILRKLQYLSEVHAIEQKDGGNCTDIVVYFFKPFKIGSSKPLIKSH